MPLGAEKAGLFGASATTGNYWGDGSDGAVTTSGNVTHTVANKNGSYDGDMYVANYTSLSIGAGHTMTVDQPCRGLLVYVKGDCTISGTLSMALKGGAANPTASGGNDSSAVSSTGIRLPMLKSSSSETLAAADFAGCGSAAVTAVANQPGISGDGKIYTIARAGASGGASASTPSCGNSGSPGGNAGNTGSAGSSSLPISTGGGGSGAAARHYGSPSSTSGAGGAGGCFSGGAGGGGCVSRHGAYPGSDGADYGGAGGDGGSAGGSSGTAGGAGNPSGANNVSGVSFTEAEDGSGGLLILLVKGDLTVNSGGSILATGAAGSTDGAGYAAANSGGTGGGAILILHGGTYTNNGTVAAAGGASGNGTAGCTGANHVSPGGAGGAGGVFVEQVDE